MGGRAGTALARRRPGATACSSARSCLRRTAIHTIRDVAGNLSASPRPRAGRSFGAHSKFAKLRCAVSATPSPKSKQSKLRRIALYHFAGCVPQLGMQKRRKYRARSAPTRGFTRVLRLRANSASLLANYAARNTWGGATSLDRTSLLATPRYRFGFDRPTLPTAAAHPSKASPSHCFLRSKPGPRSCAEAP